ncbi:hypothetical protein GCM10017556_38460 [Micromonospora sagamiensis]|nr:hypothetical protein GCM10017556_38460 [Micromonospora sagamiensis]
MTGAGSWTEQVTGLRVAVPGGGSPDDRFPVVPGGQQEAMIGQLRSVVIDCPDPRALAAFYGELLGLSIAEEETDDDWVVLGGPPGQHPRIAFQMAPDLRPPNWPDPERPQQFHLDVQVDDVDAAEQRVLALGARRLPGEGDGFRVYADPAGHPFCLVFE